MMMVMMTDDGDDDSDCDEDGDGDGDDEVTMTAIVTVMAMVILTEFFWFYLCSAVQEGILRRSRKIKERADWPFGFDASPTLDLLLLPFGFVAGDDNCRQLFIVFAGIASLYKLNPGSRLEM